MTIQAFCVLIWAISQTCGALKSKFISIQLIINNNQIITTMTTQLATGLGGAIGCDFRTAQNQLIFVEYAGGKLSSLNLFPVATIVAQSPSTVLKGTFLFDFDTGVEGGLSPNADVFWEQMTAVLRQMAPQNTDKIVNLGPVDFNSLTAVTLQRDRKST